MNGNVASVGEPSSNGAGPSTTTTAGEQNGSAPDHHGNGVDNSNGGTGEHSEGNDSGQVRGR